MSGAWLSSSAAARYLNVTPSTIKRWADEGRLKCSKTQGGHRRFFKTDLDAMGMDHAEPVSLYENLPEMGPEQLDAQNIGIIQLDDDGVILQYNSTEAVFSGRLPETVIGKRFFIDVAPCTNNRLVYGRFREGVRTGKLNHTIPYTFTYVMEPTVVILQLYRNERTRTNWLLITHYA